MAQVQQLYNQGKLGQLSRNGKLDIADHDLYSVVLASLSCISLEKTWQKLIAQHYIGSWQQVPKFELLCRAYPATSRVLMQKKIALYELNYMLDWSAFEKVLAQNWAQASSIRTWRLIVRPDEKQLEQFSDIRSGIGGSSSGFTRNKTFSASTSSRTPSVSSRNMPNNNFSISVGPGHNRSTSAHAGGRYLAPASFNQSTSSRPTTAIPNSRPSSSLETTSSDEDILSQGRRQGMQSLPSIQSSVTSSQRPTTMQGRRSQSSSAMNQLNSQSSLMGTRELSVSTAMSQLRLDDGESSQLPLGRSLSHNPFLRNGSNLGTDGSGGALVLFEPPEGGLVAPQSPSMIPVRNKRISLPATPSRNPKTSPRKSMRFASNSNNDPFLAWDVRGRLEDMEAMYFEMKNTVAGTKVERSGLEEAVELYKAKIAELESLRAQLSSSNITLQTDLDAMRKNSEMLQQKLLTTNSSLDDQLRAHRIELDDSKREHRNEVDRVRRDHTDEIDRLIRLHRDEIRELERRTTLELDDKVRDMEKRNHDNLEEERIRRLREVQELEVQITKGNQNLNLGLEQKERDLQNLRAELDKVKGELEREQASKENAEKSITELKGALQKTGVETSTTIQTLENTVSSLRARIHFLESGSKAQSDSFADMESRLQEAIRSAEVSKQKLVKEESLRRILFNQVQELKGNIRVMCRVRPVFNSEEGHAAKLKYPDTDKESKELEVLGKEEKSSLGNVTRKAHSFSFDRVFGPESNNEEVFGEISQLVQSALDGYNVCIFCYGQTGSGKTHTMSSSDGMIPRATHQIYETATNLQEKGWTYTMEGSFVEVYNEEIHDLVGNSKDFDKKKHEVRHDEHKKQTIVTGLRSVPLDSPNAVESILKQADANRSVAATKSNERSSRSHSVFMLKLVGRNSVTNETSEGTLNLVDLAGSERLKQSGAEGDRMKETQNINKSLSCLGDVIGALGQGKDGGHIPYRNSKLTYLLQYSLGGNSKTLMFVMASPLEAHLSETLTSLKFATKVHNTHIGTAKKSTKVLWLCNDSFLKKLSSLKDRQQFVLQQPSTSTIPPCATPTPSLQELKQLIMLAPSE
ncbi:Kinesin-like protein, partial [Lachnellula willkommii]